MTRFAFLIDTNPAPNQPLAAIIAAAIVATVVALWYVFSGHGKLLKWLDERIRDAFFRPPLHDDLASIIRDELARRATEVIVLDDVVARVEERERTRRVQRILAASQVVRDNGRSLDPAAVISETLLFVETVSGQKLERP